MPKFSSPRTSSLPAQAAGGLGLYVHVPFCKHACPYCDFYKFEMRERPARVRNGFPGRVGREHGLLADSISGLRERPLETIYFGGGTPSVLAPQGVAALLEEVRARHPASDPETTLEANPENLTGPRCRGWVAAGITRLSIGVQSFLPRELNLLERLHGPAVIRRAVDNAREAGIQDLSIDLMMALPGQTVDDWIMNLERALDLRPDHISLYGLTYHEGTPFDRARERGELVPTEDDTQALMYCTAALVLADAGFEHYEISNFARLGFRSRHNQRYWLAADVLGLGPGAHSNIGPARWRNPDDIDAWQAAVSGGRLPRVEVETLGPRLEAEELLFRGLRRCEGIPRDQMDRGHGALFARWLDGAVGKRAVDEGLVVTDRRGARLTLAGWLVCDSIVASVANLSGGKD